MRYVVWSLLASLVFLHQDYWQWGNASLVFGFLPDTLLYHALISLAAAVVWMLAVRFCWPSHLLADSLPRAAAEKGTGE